MKIGTLIFSFLTILTLLDNYRLTGKLFDVGQLFDTTQLHHEHMATIFILLAISFYFT